MHELATGFVMEQDAEFALDRVLGGIVRAATGNPANCPDPKKDPAASMSYQRAINQPGIITASIGQQDASQKAACLNQKDTLL